MNDENKEMIVRKLNTIIQDYSCSVLENEENKKKIDLHQYESMVRTSRNNWKKIWKRLRIYNGPYRHEKFNDQIDIPYSFDVNQPYQPQILNIFTHKIDKYMTKSKARPFLKIRLIEPKMELDYREFLANKQGANIKAQKFNQFNSKVKVISSSKVDKNVVIDFIGKGLTKTFKALFTPIKSITNIVQNKKKYVPKTDQKKLTSLVNDPILFTSNVQWIKTLTIRNGILSLTKSNLYFFYDSIEQKESHISTMNYVLPFDRKLQKVWPLKHFEYIQLKNYILRNTALEIFLKDGQSLLFNFVQKNQNQLMGEKIIELKELSCPNLKYFKTLEQQKIMEKQKYTKKWHKKKISNFQYLMFLNILANRSYKDVMQYPVMPWILTNYSADSINPNDESIYRNLNLNMGSVGNKDRTKQYIDRFNTINQQDMPPFHFGSHYSSPAIIFQFLLRLQPFTEGAKIMQNGKFDIPDRLFYSIKDSYHCATEDLSDVRELCPEFYSIPEIFLNIDKINFGIMQTGQRVDNVLLPNWTNRNPYKFVYYLRIALESQQVSQNIQNWIDLTFGYKQRGKEAEKAMNVYFHLTYDDQIDLDNIEDEQLKIAIETQIINFGQTPIQLLQKNHPAKIEQNHKIKIFINPNVKVFTPSLKKNKQKQDKHQKININLFTMHEDNIIKMRFVDEEKLFVLKRNGQVVFYKFWNTPLNSNLKGIMPFQFMLDKTKRINLEKFNNQFISMIDYTINSIDYPVEFLDNYKIAVIGGFYNGAIKTLIIENNEELMQYFQHQHTVTIIKSDNKKKFLYTGTIQGDVISWQIDQKSFQLQKMFRYFDHQQEICCISVNDQLRIFATGSLDCQVNIYNKYNGLYLRTIFHPNNQPLSNIILASFPFPILVIYSNTDNELYTYSLNGQMIEKKILNHNYILDPQIVIDHDFTEFLIYGTDQGQIIVRDLPFLQIRINPMIGPNTHVTQIAIHPEYQYMFCSNLGDVSILTTLDN